MTSWHLVLNGETSVVIYAGNADDFDDEIGVGSRAFNAHTHVGTPRKQVIRPVRLLGAGLRAICSASVSCLLIYSFTDLLFNDSSQASYLNIYPSDLR